MYVTTSVWVKLPKLAMLRIHLDMTLAVEQNIIPIFDLCVKIQWHKGISEWYCWYLYVENYAVDMQVMKNGMFTLPRINSKYL